MVEVDDMLEVMSAAMITNEQEGRQVCATFQSSNDGNIDMVKLGS